MAQARKDERETYPGCDQRHSSQAQTCRTNANPPSLYSLKSSRSKASWMRLQQGRGGMSGLPPDALVSFADRRLPSGGRDYAMTFEDTCTSWRLSDSSCLEAGTTLRMGASNDLTGQRLADDYSALRSLPLIPTSSVPPTGLSMFAFPLVHAFAQNDRASQLRGSTNPWSPRSARKGPYLAKPSPDAHPPTSLETCPTDHCIDRDRVLREQDRRRNDRRPVLSKCLARPRSERDSE